MSSCSTPVDPVHLFESTVEEIASQVNNKLVNLRVGPNRLPL